MSDVQSLLLQTILWSIILECVVMGSSRVLKWPVLVLLILWMAVDLVCYALVRLLIRGVDLIQSALRPGDISALLERLDNAKDYQSWFALAEAADEKEGRMAWRREQHSRLFDANAVTRMTARLAQARARNDVPAVIAALQGCLVTNAYGVNREQNYLFARTGPKLPVQNFVSEVCTSIRWLQSTGQTASRAEAEATLVAVEREQASHGNPALMLSGGAALGTYHFGILKGLFLHSCLPSVIFGASAGSIVGSLACCWTDDELRDFFQTDEGFETLWRGFIYDAEPFREQLKFFTKGLTFLEAYERSGRTLVISATPFRVGHSGGGHGPPLMLNYRDAPNVDIASAICASSAVPGLMDKTALLEKAPDGFLRTFGGDDEASSANGMRDGSFEADMPLQYLAAHFGCSFAIVSMVNPQAPSALSLFLFTLGEGGFLMVNLSGMPPFPTLVHPSGDSLGWGCCTCWCCGCACGAAAGAAAAAGGAAGGAAAEVAAGTGCGGALPSLACCRSLSLSHWDWGWTMNCLPMGVGLTLKLHQLRSTASCERMRIIASSCGATASPVACAHSLSLAATDGPSRASAMAPFRRFVKFPSHSGLYKILFPIFACSSLVISARGHTPQASNHSMMRLH
ncbi:hypothetical protein EMIHUDRAFT_217262 [Emiliania huxleyi CCMP1516]|uniref:PNPLA domain-containing protein n=2 Tax=Emiliania huxleyi TaxID=2903 RepID=A0A0D3IBC6_EMIH1|nr:hypothetical protein EMIHUDRAFT_217262 [Emiliania huxleyi CCMP1516]EOD08561.1 hypothetical protein EMIHUDRAFT_217262 [Emiliania huxleyi CCMP1516]|eukprot:XP_005760990.1 hypothetical protein EMIHUDRAFT_217262 [Emiliania huxleyi CCMP1516]